MPQALYPRLQGPGAKPLDPGSRALCCTPWAQVEVHAEGEEDFRAWEGWVHSRMRLLVMAMQQVVKVRPWPKTVKGPEGAEGRHSCFHYMGIAKLPVRPAHPACTPFTPLKPRYKRARRAAAAASTIWGSPSCRCARRTPPVPPLRP